MLMAKRVFPSAMVLVVAPEITGAGADARPRARREEVEISNSNKPGDLVDPPNLYPICTC